MAVCLVGGAVSINSDLQDSDEYEYETLGATTATKTIKVVKNTWFSETIKLGSISQGEIKVQTKPSWVILQGVTNTASGTLMINGSCKLTGYAPSDLGFYEVVLYHPYAGGLLGNKWMTTTIIIQVVNEIVDEPDDTISIPTVWDMIFQALTSLEFWLIFGGGFLLMSFTISRIRNKRLRR
jgi:hypothetical protein